MDMDDDEVESEENRLLSICFEGKKIGLAFFDEVNSVIYLSGMFEVSQNDIDALLSNVKEHCHPSLILVQSKTVTNKPLLDLVCQRDDGGGDIYPFQVIKNNFWRYDNVVSDMLVRFNVQSYRPEQRVNVQQLTYQENMIRISACVDLDNRPIVSAMGALLHHLRTDIFTLDSGFVQVSDVRPLVVDEYLRIDSATFKSLQIFCEDQHPLLFKEKGRSKEGFSLFSLLDRTVSLPGRKRLRAWLSTPFYSREKILERQDGVEMVARSSNAEFVGELVKLLRHTHDLPKILLRIKKVNAGHMDWVKLYQTVDNALPIIDTISLFLQQQSSPTQHCSTLKSSDKTYLDTLLVNLNIQVIRNMCGTLHAAIDISNTKESKQVMICDGYDETLDSLRYIYDHLDDELTQIAKEILQQAPLLSHVSVEYLPQVGYLIAIQEDDQHFLPRTSASDVVREENQDLQYSQQHVNSPSPFFTSSSSSSGRFGDIVSTPRQETDADTSQRSSQQWQQLNEGVHPPEYQHIYTSEGMMYFKHAVVYDIDETIGDIHARVLDRQKDLLLEVECAVLECEYHFLQLAVILESLDAIISLGTISKERNYVRPEIVEDPVVIVKSGRHPLQELTVDDFIPNDIFMSPDKHIGVITGLNGSGKSIYLKQVGLLVYLAHVGSFLPCERAVIGLCDRILTRVSSVETAVCPLSAFMLDLSQLKRMLDLFTARSLCLIDEFGKGTAPVDGMALLAATIMHFHRTPPCRVMFTTHFLEIFHKDIIDISCLSSVTTFKMDTYVDSLSPNDGAVATKAAAVSMQHVAAVGEISPRVAAATNMEVASAAAGMRVDVTPLEEVPLYKLKVGLAASSGGIACARKAGVPQDVLRRAEELQQCFLNQSLLRPLTIPTHQKAISTRLTSFPDDSSDPTSYSGVSPHANSRDSGLSDYEQQELQVLKLFFDVDSWQAAKEINVQALLNSIQNLK